MTIDEMISKLVNLPPAPRVLPKLLQLLNDMNSSTEDIVSLIEIDASLTAKLLGISNSAFYGGSSISDVVEAVNRLGFQEIYRVVTNICGRSFVGGDMEAYQMDADERWFNSVATGLVMELISRKLGIADSSVAYTVGLLHDIGKTAMNQVFASDYNELLDRVENEGIELRVAEKSVFGFDHAEAGAALMESWDFPSELTEPVQFQYEPDGASEHQQLASLLHLSRWIAASIGGAPGRNAWAFQLDDAILEVLKVDSNQIMELMIDSKELIQQKEDMLSL